MPLPTHEEIVAAVRAHENELVALLSSLVSFPSLLHAESGVQEFCASYMAESLKLEVSRVPLDHAQLAQLRGYSPPYLGATPSKESVHGMHRPSGAIPAGSRPLIFNGHTDVVPVSGSEERWTSPPFAPAVRDGRLYGRGSADMKAGVAAMLFALRVLRTLGVQPANHVCVQCVVEEENSGNGALASAAAIADLVKPGAALHGAGVVVPEPFAQKITLCQIGTVWMQLVVKGRPAHVLNTAAGSNAIEAAFSLWQSMKELEAQLNEPASRHPAYAEHAHPVNFNLGVIEGGDWPSSVPSSCKMQVRIATYPGVLLADFRQTVEKFVASACAAKGIEAAITWSGFQAEGSVVERSDGFLQLLAAKHKQVMGSDVEYSHLTCTTDARHFINLLGLPATCYGPEGNPIHGIDESVSIQSTVDVAAVLALTIADWCGLEPVS